MSSGNPKGGKPEAPAHTGKDEPTTIFPLAQFKGKARMPNTPGKLLSTLQDQIGKLKIEQSGSGIRHDDDGSYAVLPKTLHSAWLARVNHPVVGQVAFLFGQTRSTWVVLYDQPHERLYEDPRFMGIELKRRDVAVTPKGKKMYVSRIEKTDLDKINAIAARDAARSDQPDTFVPIEGVAFSTEESVKRLRKCKLEDCTDSSFDLVQFAESINFMTATQGDDNSYYIIDSGDQDNPVMSELFVGKDPELPNSAYRHRATLFYRYESCFLYIGVNY